MSWVFVAIIIFVKYLDARILRAIDKSIKRINNSVFIAEPEQQVVNKVWDHKMTNE